MVAACLRDRWAYATIATLHTRPASPSELLAAFQAARSETAALVGPALVYGKCVTRHVGLLSRRGLIEAVSRQGQGRRREYRTTDLGTALLDSLGPAAAFGADRYFWLAHHCREMRRVDAWLPVPPPGTGSAQAATMLFAVLLRPRWTLAVLAVLAGGPLRFTQITAAVNSVAEANRDVAPGRISDSVLHERLITLQRLGLVVLVPVLPGRRIAYALTTDGRALMEALEAVAAFGVKHDVELTAAFLAG